MFVITLTYTAPLDEVDALLPEHTAWLAEHYATGEFLAAGRQIPRVGGVVFAAGSVVRERLDAIVAADPFNVHGVAEYSIVEFIPSRTLPGLEQLIDG
jgi:uncharacterized protein YciI